jgi:hypothetical protein
MKTLSLKISDALDRRIAHEVARRRIPKSTLVRELLEAQLAEGRPARPQSVLSKIGDLAGTTSGPRDLSSNPRHLKDYGA